MGSIVGGGLQNQALSERFEVLSVLGDGAAGFVYRVRDRVRGGQEVALKVLANDLAFDEATLDRFIQELKVCQALRHPNLVEAYDLIEIGDTVAYTMEFVDGGSLQGLFAQQKIGHEAIDRIFEQVLDAVQLLHENGVIHRDIKLENVLVRTDGTVKITDLGLMKQMGNKAMTRPGILLGTPQYMPPEYVKQSVYDQRGDIYTLGLMLYELLTGKRWLSHLRGQEVINHLIKTKFEVCRQSLAGVPPKYCKILALALELDPKKRYQSAREMKADFLGRAEHPEPMVEDGLEIRGGLQIQNYSAALEAPQPAVWNTLWFRLGTALVVGVLGTILAAAVLLK